MALNAVGLLQASTLLFFDYTGYARPVTIAEEVEEPVYGLALIEELRRHGYELSPGTLYPILHSLEDAGYLRREDRRVGGKARKYYAITEEGRRALAEARQKIAKLVREVLEGHGPTSLPAPAEAEPEGEE